MSGFSSKSVTDPGLARAPHGAPRPTNDEPRDGFTGLGRVIRVHGLRGEVRAIAFHPAAPHLRAGRAIYVNGTEYTIVRARDDRGQWILELSGLSDRDQAEALRGLLIEARDADVQRDDEESYFLHELIGLRMETDTGEDLGVVTEVLQPGGANDVYVVKGGRGEVLIPAIADVIRSVDLAGGVIIITPLPGLLDEST